MVVFLTLSVWYFLNISLLLIFPQKCLSRATTRQITCKTATAGAYQAECKLRICQIGVMNGTIVPLCGALQPLDAKSNFYLMNTKATTHKLCNLVIKTADLGEESWA